MNESPSNLWSFFWRSPVFTKLKLCGLLLIAVGMVVGTLILVGAVVRVSFKNSSENDISSAPILVENHPEFEVNYLLKDISIPLVDRASTKIAYAQFSLMLDCPTNACKRAMELHRPKLLDRIFEVASKFYLEDFAQAKGFEKFKHAFLTTLRKDFNEMAPRQVTIENWVIN